MMVLWIGMFASGLSLGFYSQLYNICKTHVVAVWVASVYQSCKNSTTQQIYVYYTTKVQIFLMSVPDFLISSNILAPDKSGYPCSIFLISPAKHICCGYPLDAPHWGTSNGYHNICFRCEIKKLSALFSWKTKALSGNMLTSLTAF